MKESKIGQKVDVSDWPVKAFLRQGLPLMGLGLYASRLLAEQGKKPWSLFLLLPLMVACLVVAWFSVRLMANKNIDSRPLLLLWLYVLWPIAWPGLAAALLLTTISWILLASIPDQRPRMALPYTVFVLAMALYLITLAPTILPSDSGEFQTVAALLGIAHPPGYPLYTLLGKLFTLLPVGDVAYRVNLFGAVCGAATLAVLAQLVQGTSGSWSAGLAAAVALAVSPTFWSQSTIANIRSLTALFAALSLHLLLCWGRDRNSHTLVGFAFCFGLGVGHHSSLALLALPLGINILIREPEILRRPRRWIAPLGAFAASLLVLLYLPLRSSTTDAFGSAPIDTWEEFLEHVLALGFRGDMLYVDSLARLSSRLQILVDILRIQFGWPLLALTLSATVATAAKRWRTMILLLGAAAINALSAITYRAPQTVEYLLPAYIALIALLGCGLGLLAQAKRSRRWGLLLISVVLTLGAWNACANYDDFRTLHRDRSAREYAENVLHNAPEGAVILSNWHRVTAFRYLQQVEGLRPDIEMRYVYPEGATPNEQVWLERIAENVGQRPVIVTNWFYEYGQTDYYWIPFHGAWLVQEEAPRSPPSEIVQETATFESKAGAAIRILGYRMSSDGLTSGHTLTVQVFWQVLQPLEHDYSSFLHVMGPDGVVGQDDIVHASSEYVDGRVRSDVYRVPLLLQTPPGTYQLFTGFYYADEEGWQRLNTGSADHLSLGSVEVQPRNRTPASLHPMHRPYQDGWSMTGMDVDRSIAGQTRLYLHWRRERGQSNASLHLSTADGAQFQSSLPTLAGGQSATIVFDLPEDTERVRLSLYDSAGSRLALLGPWHVTRGDGWLNLPGGDAHYLPLGGEMALVGLRVEAEKIGAGGDVLLTPTFLSLAPLQQDYSVSVGLRDAASGWHHKSDGVPATGAIPTLKWLTGWRVRDPHTVIVPEKVPAESLRITLSVYDRSTKSLLQVLDERFAQRGQGTEPMLDEIPVKAP